MLEGPDAKLVELMQALSIRDHDRARVLLRQTPHLSSQVFGQQEMTPLMACACDPKQFEPTLFRELVRATQEVNRINKRGRAVVHYLVQYNRAELLQILLEEKKDAIDLNVLTQANESPV